VSARCAVSVTLQRALGVALRAASAVVMRV